MQKFKIFSKYFFNDEYIKFTLKTKTFLVRSDFENIDKINNMSFLQLITNYEIAEKDNPKKPIKLIDYFLNFPIEKFLFLNILFPQFPHYLKTKQKNKQILTNFSFLSKIKFKRLKSSRAIDPDKIKEPEFPPYLTDEYKKEVLLYEFEMNFIKHSLKEKAKFTYVPRGLKIINSKIIFSKNLSNFQSQNNKKIEKPQGENKNQVSENLQKTLNEKIKTKEDDINLYSINDYYYLKLLREIKKKERQLFSSRINSQRELKFLQLRIRNRKVNKLNKIIKPITQVINVKNMLLLVNKIQKLFLKLKKLMILCKKYYQSLEEKKEEIQVNNDINESNIKKENVEDNINKIQESEKSKDDKEKNII